MAGRKLPPGIRYHEGKPKPYEVVVDLGPDPAKLGPNGKSKRRQRSKSFATLSEDRKAQTAWKAEIGKGTVVDRSTKTVAELMRYWLNTYPAAKNLSPVTVDGYTRIVNN